MAHERGRAATPGVNADKPQDMPACGWKDILLRVKGRVSRDNIGLVAAGVAFYSLLSLFPLLIALVSIYSLFFDISAVEQQMASLSSLLPNEAASIISNQLHTIVSSSSGALGWGTALSVLGALWSASKGSKAIIEGFNIVYEESEQRSFVVLSLIALALTLGAVIFLIVALVLVALLPAVLNFLELDRALTLAVSMGRWVLLALMINIGLAVLNRYAPSRDKAKWSWVSLGATVSTLLFLLISVGFSFYTSNFGKYNEVYGSLGGVVVMLLWLYLSSYSILLGAEFNAEAELQTAKDTTVGKEKPLGERGAVKADNRPRAAS